MLDIRNEAAAEEKKSSRLSDRIDESIILQRRLFLCQGVDNKIVNDLIRKVWYLEEQDPGKPIYFFINSPGGSVTDGMALWDQLQLISSPVYTIVTGLAASMGSFLTIAAEKGRRFSTPNARFMVHQPAIHGFMQGQASDLEIQAREMLKLRKEFIRVYCDRTGQSKEVVEKALTRDTWMSAQEALEWGHIDKIITSVKDIY